MFLRRKIGSSATDEDLVAAVRDGHQPALGSLWDRYAQLLFGVCMKYLKDTERSKDLVVELFADLPALLGRHAVGAWWQSLAMQPTRQSSTLVRWREASGRPPMLE